MQEKRHDRVVEMRLCFFLGKVGDYNVSFVETRMCRSTPYSFLKSQITYALRPKITYAGKAVKLRKEVLNETITAVRNVNHVPD